MIDENIFNFTTDREIISKTFDMLRHLGETIVLTNGCFDVLHVGHVNLINNSKSYGDNLIVAINSDMSIKAIKGENRPIVNQEDRAFILSSLRSVDYVIIYDENTPIELLKVVKPDVLAKGAEYTVDKVVGHEIVEEYGGKIVRIPMSQGKSTTNVVKKINELD